MDKHEKTDNWHWLKKRYKLKASQISFINYPKQITKPMKRGIGLTFERIQILFMRRNQLINIGL
jgi:hypothetical protein